MGWLKNEKTKPKKLAAPKKGWLELGCAWKEDLATKKEAEGWPPKRARAYAWGSEG